jgi:hypothetical protein
VGIVPPLRHTIGLLVYLSCFVGILKLAVWQPFLQGGRSIVCMCVSTIVLSVITWQGAFILLGFFLLRRGWRVLAASAG